MVEVSGTGEQPNNNSLVGVRVENLLHQVQAMRGGRVPANRFNTDYTLQVIEAVLNHLVEDNDGAEFKILGSTDLTFKISDQEASKGDQK